MNENQRQEIAELKQILIVNKNRLDPKQYKELEIEINRKIEEIEK